MTIYNLNDRVPLGDSAQITITKDGYLAAAPRVARANNVQLYLGSEVGKPGVPVVRVFRPADAVFERASLDTYAHKPVTDDHPAQPVDATNWRLHGRGHLDRDVVRDGEFVRVPMLLMDADLISKVRSGKSELSVGYGCNITFNAGVTDSGQEYDAVQSDIRVNHVAVVDAARGGKELRIGDGTGTAVDLNAMMTLVTAIQNGKVDTTNHLTDAGSLDLAQTKNSPYRFTDANGVVYVRSLDAAIATAAGAKEGDILAAVQSLQALIADQDDPAAALSQHKETTDMSDTNKSTVAVMIDGISVNMDDTAAQHVRRVMAAHDAALKVANDKIAAMTATHDAALKAANDQVAVLTTNVATKDAEIVTLKSQVADSALTPAKLDALVADRNNTIGKAKAIMGDKLVIDGKSVAEIHKQVVAHKVTDAACAGWTPEQFAASFAALTADVKVATPAAGGVQQVAGAFGDRNTAVGSQQEVATAYQQRDRAISEAWKTGAVVAPATAQ